MLRLATSKSSRRFSSITLNSFPAQVTTLSNGVRVVSQQTFDEVVSVNLHLDTGSRIGSVQGISNFVERATRHGGTKADGVKVFQKAEMLGCDIASETNMESVNISGSFFKTDVAKGLEILGDLALNPALDADTVEAVRSQILFDQEHEVRSSEEVLMERIHMNCFRDGSLGFAKSGNDEAVRVMTAEQLNAHVADHHTAERIIVSATGPVNHAELVAAAQAKFGGLKRGPPRHVQEKPYFLGAELLYRTDDMGPFAHVIVSYQGVPARSADAPAFTLIQNILGNFQRDSNIVPDKLSGNRMVNNVANKMNVGCAETLKAFYHPYKDTGLFGIYAMADEVALMHCVEEMMFAVNQMSHSVTEEEVSRGKRQLLLKVNVTGHELAKRNAWQTVQYGRVMPSEEFFHRINVLNAEEIKRVAYKYIHDNEVATTALGPLHGMPNLYECRRMNIMYRY